MNKYLILIALLGLMSCNGGCNNANSSSQVNGEVDHTNFVPKVPKEDIGKDIDLSNRRGQGTFFRRHACSLVSATSAAEALGKTKEEIVLRNATPRDADPAQTACFYKWTDHDLPNAGLFIQLLRNPLGDEYPNYISLMIQSKLDKGEQTIDGEPIIFKQYRGFGDAGAYSTEGGKYFWRIGEDVVFHIAFNTLHGPEEQYEIAGKLAKTLTENFLK